MVSDPTYTAFRLHCPVLPKLREKCTSKTCNRIKVTPPWQSSSCDVIQSGALQISLGKNVKWNKYPFHVCSDFAELQRGIWCFCWSLFDVNSYTVWMCVVKNWLQNIWKNSCTRETSIWYCCNYFFDIMPTKQFLI